MGLISEKTEVLEAELTEIAEAATSSVSATDDCACGKESSEVPIEMFKL